MTTPEMTRPSSIDWKPTAILLLPALPGPSECRLERRGRLVRGSTAASRSAAIHQHAQDTQVVVTTGAAGLTAEEIRQLPAPRLTCC